MNWWDCFSAAPVASWRARDRQSFLVRAATRPVRRKLKSETCVSSEVRSIICAGFISSHVKCICNVAIGQRTRRAAGRSTALQVASLKFSLRPKWDARQSAYLAVFPGLVRLDDHPAARVLLIQARSSDVLRLHRRRSLSLTLRHQLPTCITWQSQKNVGECRFRRKQWSGSFRAFDGSAP